MRIGVDTGGTFTDCVLVSGGRVKILKVFSTPEDAARGILEGVRRLASSLDAAWPSQIVHGTTVGTNGLLERRGARVALLTTAGFEDLLEMGRQARPRLYDLNVQREPALVPRSLRIGVSERVTADGKTLLRPTTSELARIRRRLKRSQVDSLAVCFLFSFANPANERAVARTLGGLGIPISISHQILPEFREFERLSAVVINAYLEPKMGTYLANLQRAAAEGLAAPATPHPSVDDLLRTRHRPAPMGACRVYVMQSNGGIATAARAAREPVRTLLSGPCGGVMATAWLARSLGMARVISFDMGGTSTDVCLLDGPPRTTNETTLGGLPVAVPVLDVHSVGAGGGSLARLDAGGALRVGPESAGAVPGPLCYARGGTQPTVTDANLLLGRLDPQHFLGGEFCLDVSSAEQGFAEFLRQVPHCAWRRAHFRTEKDLAAGIVAVSNATMEKALRVISVERGHDPREFALVCFGGAGGLHAADLARSLRIPRIIVPRDPGAFSALGILLSDVVRDAAQSVLLAVPADANSSAHGGRIFLRELEKRFERLERQARDELRREGFAAERARAERRLDLRYRGQSYELSVPFRASFREAFHQAHEKAYGYAHPGRPLEIVNVRLRLAIRTPQPRLAAYPSRRKDARHYLLKTREVWFEGRPRLTRFYARERLEAGAHLAGPAVILEYSSTTVVPPDYVCDVDKHLNLVLQRSDQ